MTRTAFPFFDNHGSPVAPTSCPPAAVQAFGYDDDGNLLTDGVWTYAWDAENRLKSMTTTAAAVTGGQAARTLTFQYDYLDRRVQKRVVDGAGAEITSRRYLYDGWNLVAEFALNTQLSTLSLLRSYTWGLDLTGDLTRAGGVGALVQIYDYASSKTFLPTYDGNGNIVALLNSATGGFAATYEYDPYGNYLRAEAFDPAIADNPFRFSTKYTDAESGLVYYGLRYYSPTTGRFINKDPIEEQGGLNLYAFCRNNAINKWDYLGMDPPEGDADDDGGYTRPSDGSLNGFGSGNFVGSLTGSESMGDTTTLLVDGYRDRDGKFHRLPAGTTLDAITNANRNSGGAKSNLPSPASLQAQIDATAKLKITAPSIFLTPTTTVRVLVWNDDAFSLSAGHVLVTDTGGNVILSQFPSGGVATAVSDQHDNTTFSPEQTFRAENRPPDIVLVITVPNARGFFSAAVDHRTRADWSWNPSGCDETNCSWAAYGALRAGGVDLPVYTDDMLPRTLGTDLLNAAQNNSNIQVVDQPRPPRG